MPQNDKGLSTSENASEVSERPTELREAITERPGDLEQITEQKLNELQASSRILALNHTNAEIFVATAMNLFNALNDTILIYNSEKGPLQKLEILQNMDESINQLDSEYQGWLLGDAFRYQEIREALKDQLISERQTLSTSIAMESSHQTELKLMNAANKKELLEWLMYEQQPSSHEVNKFIHQHKLKRLPVRANSTMCKGGADGQAPFLLRVNSVRTLGSSSYQKELAKGPLAEYFVDRDYEDHLFKSVDDDLGEVFLFESMPLMEGSLKDEIKQRKEQTVSVVQKQTLETFLQMAAIFKKTSEQGAVFQDAKNGNWLRNREGKLKLADLKSFKKQTSPGVFDISVGGDSAFSPENQPPETIGRNAIFDIDKAHAYMFGKDLYQFMTGCDDNFLFDRTTFIESDFDSEVFQNNKGILFKQLIKSTVTADPATRISIEQAEEYLNHIETFEKLSTNDQLALTTMIERLDSVEERSDLIMQKTLVFLNGPSEERVNLVQKAHDRHEALQETLRAFDELANEYRQVTFGLFDREKQEKLQAIASEGNMKFTMFDGQELTTIKLERLIAFKRQQIANSPVEERAEQLAEFRKDLQTLNEEQENFQRLAEQYRELHYQQNDILRESPIVAAACSIVAASPETRQEQLKKFSNTVADRHTKIREQTEQSFDDLSQRFLKLTVKIQTGESPEAYLQRKHLEIMKSKKPQDADTILDKFREKVEKQEIKDEFQVLARRYHRLSFDKKEDSILYTTERKAKLKESSLDNSRVELNNFREEVMLLEALENRMNTLNNLTRRLQGGARRAREIKDSVHAIPNAERRLAIKSIVDREMPTRSPGSPDSGVTDRLSSMDSKRSTSSADTSDDEVERLERALSRDRGNESSTRTMRRLKEEYQEIRRQCASTDTEKTGSISPMSSHSNSS